MHSAAMRRFFLAALLLQRAKNPSPRSLRNRQRNRRKRKRKAKERPKKRRKTLLPFRGSRRLTPDLRRVVREGRQGARMRMHSCTRNPLCRLPVPVNVLLVDGLSDCRSCKCGCVELQCYLYNMLGIEIVHPRKCLLKGICCLVPYAFCLSKVPSSSAQAAQKAAPPPRIQYSALCSLRATASFTNT